MVWRHVDLKSPHIAKLIAQLAAAKTVLDPTLSIDEYDSLFSYPAQASHLTTVSSDNRSWMKRWDPNIKFSKCRATSRQTRVQVWRSGVRSSACAIAQE
jgi:hypothetical protein